MTNKILCDSDFIISLLCEEESTHFLATEIYNNNFDKGSEFWTMNINFYEISTVLSRKYEQSRAIKTFDLVQYNFNRVIRITEEDEKEIYKLYRSFNKKNISFFDCACQVVATKNSMKIASFDKFYNFDLLV